MKINVSWETWMSALSAGAEEQIARETGFVLPSGRYDMSKAEQFNAAVNDARIDALATRQFLADPFSKENGALVVRLEGAK